MANIFCNLKALIWFKMTHCDDGLKKLKPRKPCRIQSMYLHLLKQNLSKISWTCTLVCGCALRSISDPIRLWAIVHCPQQHRWSFGLCRTWCDLNRILAGNQSIECLASEHYVWFSWLWSHLKMSKNMLWVVARLHYGKFWWILKNINQVIF